MLKLDETELLRFRSGMQNLLMLPMYLGSKAIVREVLAVGSADNPEYCCVTQVQTGSITYFSHNKELLRQNAFAHPHELIDFLKKKYPAEKYDNPDEPWVLLRMYYVPDWHKWSPDKIGNALFALAFKINQGKVRA